jgi:hypothetical protein
MVVSPKMHKSLIVDGVSKVDANDFGNDLWIREVIFSDRENI